MHKVHGENVEHEGNGNGSHNPLFATIFWKIFLC